MKSSSFLSRLNMSPRQSRRCFLAKKSGSPYSANPRVYINSSPRLTLRWSSVNLRWSESPVHHGKLLIGVACVKCKFLVISTIGSGSSSMTEVQGKVHLRAVLHRTFRCSFSIVICNWCWWETSGRFGLELHYRTIWDEEISCVKVFWGLCVCKQSFWQQFKDQT